MLCYNIIIPGQTKTPEARAASRTPDRRCYETFPVPGFARQIQQVRRFGQAGPHPSAIARRTGKATTGRGRRGALLIWFGAKTGLPGRPSVFSDAAIRFSLMMTVLLGRPRRQTTGLVGRIVEMGADWPAPDLSPQSRRQKPLKVQIPDRGPPGPLIFTALIVPVPPPERSERRETLPLGLARRPASLPPEASRIPIAEWGHNTSPPSITSANPVTKDDRGDAR